MANNSNLKPLTTEKAREIGKKGGIASGKARKTRRTIRDTMELLLSQPFTADEAAKIAEFGLDPADTDRRAAMVVALYQRAIDGDHKAFQIISEMLCENWQTGEDKDRAKANKERNEALFSSMR